MRRHGPAGRALSGRRWHLMDEWRDAFVTELRLRDVPGTQVGEALAEVDAHCTDSGQTPAEAFGDPVSYAAARAADLAVKPHRTPLRIAWMSFAGVAGALAVLVGTDAVAHRTQGELTLGALLTLALAPPLIAGITALALRPGAGRRAPVLVAVGTVVTMAASGVSPMIWPQVVASLPGPVLLVTGAVVLTVAWWRLTSGRAFADRVVDPRSGQEPFPVPRWLLLLLRFGPPTLLALAATVVALIPAAQP
jgi:hypothetical protein